MRPAINAVALHQANKTARIIWALLARGGVYGAPSRAQAEAA